MSATMPEFVPMDAPDLDPNAPLLEIRDLEVAFQSSTGMVPAVRGANLRRTTRGAAPVLGLATSVLWRPPRFAALELIPR